MVVWVVALSTPDLSTRGLSARLCSAVFGVWLGLVRLWVPLAHPVLYPRRQYLTIYLNRFRGEPAISEFDWPFTPSHSSSPTFSTGVGSALQWVLPHLQPGHG
jgi:hypothetical protein